MNQDKKQALAGIDLRQEKICGLSNAIFDNPETAFEEHIAADLMCTMLEEEGFSVVRGVSGMATAYVARYGVGKPVIGLLAEYDALPGMSQEAGALSAHPVTPDAPGHACGHNLLGAGALAAALSVKDYLSHTGGSGTVICYGCPGEEGGSGKAFMARDGLFDELDAALTWHPESVNIVPPSATLANYQMGFRFKGIAAHASSAPYLGRSALDGLELMCTGIQYLREHIIPEARIHYAITNAGGTAPNVVQAEAEGQFVIRAPHASQVAEIYKRVQNIARGAALMTDTEVKETSFKAIYDIMPNHTLGKILSENLQAFGSPTYTGEEWDYAKAVNDTITHPNQLLKMAAGFMGSKGQEMVAPYLSKPIYDLTLPYVPIRHVLPSSSDVGDVSWVTPTAQVAVATMCANTSAHTWQLASQGKSSIAHKGMLLAAKVMAGGAIDLLDNPEMLQAARQEHQQAVGDGYKPLIPDHISP